MGLEIAGGANRYLGLVEDVIPKCCCVLYRKSIFKYFRRVVQKSSAQRDWKTIPPHWICIGSPKLYK